MSLVGEFLECIHVPRLVHEANSSYTCLCSRIKALKPFDEFVGNPKSSLCQRNLPLTKLRGRVPKHRRQRPDAIVSTILGTPRHGMQVQKDLQSSTCCLSQKDFYFRPWDGCEAGHILVVWIRHYHRVGDRIVLGVDLVKRGESICESCPAQRQTHRGDAHLLHFLQVLLVNVVIAVGFEGISGEASAVLFQEALGKNAF
mmetsp:Transcript_19662/g.34854  ORF Transcript_19662/g.34854 Transcript_19662/m.34854 type:complete len:200 (+) Transcript_19662:642-1241(+)